MTKEQIIDKWLAIVSDDYMHFTPEQAAYVKSLMLNCSIKEYGDQGVMVWCSCVDTDCVRKTQSILFYIKPEYRGGKLFLTMIKNLETIAIAEGAKKVIIGNSTSGYKEEKFNKIFERYGYTKTGFEKKVG